MKKFTITLFAALLMLSVNGQGTLNQREKLDGIDEFILEQMEIFNVPGLSACIVIDDSVAWNNNYGYMNLEDSIPVHDSTLFTVFSIGKSFTSACLMQLWDKGLLGLNQKASDLLPFQIENPWNSSDSITARMLMSHTSSINNGNIFNYVTVGDPTITLHYFLENFLCTGGEYYSTSNYYNMNPGSTLHYDNYGIALTGFLTEAITGIDFSQYAQDSLLAPLEMNNSAWFLSELDLDNLATGYTSSGGNVPHYGHPAYPGMSLRSSSLEIANFVIMLLNNGEFKNENILSEAAVDSMSTIQDPNFYFSYGITGLGMFQRDDYGDRIVWGHNGGGDGGFANHYYFCKEENTGIVITTNSEQYVDPIVEYLFDHALLMVNTPEVTINNRSKLNIYPNPSNSNTNISIYLSEKERISIELYNIQGQKTYNISQDVKEQGLHKFILDCDNFRPGVYFIVCKTEKRAFTEKLIIE